MDFHSSNENQPQKKSEESKSSQEPAAKEEASSPIEHTSPIAAPAILQKKPGTDTLNPFGSKHTQALAAAAKKLKNIKLKPGQTVEEYYDEEVDDKSILSPYGDSAFAAAKSNLSTDV